MISIICTGRSTTCTTNSRFHLILSVGKGSWLNELWSQTRSMNTPCEVEACAKKRPLGCFLSCNLHGSFLGLVVRFHLHFMRKLKQAKVAPRLPLFFLPTSSSNLVQPIHPTLLHSF